METSSISGAWARSFSAKKHLLAQDVPALGGVPEAVQQPLLLLGAGDGAVLGEALGDVLLPAVAGELVVAVLPGVHHVEVGQLAPLDGAVDLHVEPGRHGRGPQRHVLVVRLERGGAALPEPLGGVVQLGGVRVLRDLVRPVVVHLVVIPDHQPRCDRVRGLQVGVGLVLRVPLPVAGQAGGLGALVVARVAAADHVAALLVLVHVVAQVQHQVRVVLGQPRVGGEVAVLVLRAAGERHGQRRRRLVRRRAGEGAAHRADVPAGAEPVEVLAPRPQALEFHVDRVRGFDPGGFDAAGYYRAHAGVLGHFPGDRDVAGGHAAQAVLGDRVQRQPRPDHEAVRPRLAGGDAQQERIGAEAGVVRC